MNESRVMRVARGSGTRPEEVNFLLEEYKKFAKMVEKMGKMKLNSKADMSNINRNPRQLMD
jgi:signal recognition particle subunit SRP54